MGDAPTPGRSVSIDAAAMLLKVSRRTIYNRIRDGQLQTVRTIGGSQRVLVESMPLQRGRLPANPATPLLHDALDSLDERMREHFRTNGRFDADFQKGRA